MKKSIFIVVTCLLVGMGSASAQAVWGGRIGLSKPTVSDNGGGSISGNFGLELGPVLYYQLANNWYINSGAMFSIKTFDIEDESLSMYYLDIPVYAGYSFPVGSLSLYAQAGPYIGLKLGESLDSEYGGDSGISSFNAGLGFMAGINLNRFKIELGYQAGLVNVAKDTEDGYRLNLSSLFLGVSYVF